MWFPLSRRERVGVREPQRIDHGLYLSSCPTPKERENLIRDHILTPTPPVSPAYTVEPNAHPPPPQKSVYNNTMDGHLSLQVMEIRHSVCRVTAQPSRYTKAHTVSLSPRIREKERGHACQNTRHD